MSADSILVRADALRDRQAARRGASSSGCRRHGAPRLRVAQPRRPRRTPPSPRAAVMYRLAAEQARGESASKQELEAVLATVGQLAARAQAASERQANLSRQVAAVAQTRELMVSGTSSAASALRAARVSLHSAQRLRGSLGRDGTRANSFPLVTATLQCASCI